jgi:DNA repair protein RecN (Recombination protein N)
LLETLHIENLAVIERADITFGKGLNVLTGETGAGKSIVIDALTAVTGGRASKEIVRTGEANAAVTAEFSVDEAEISQWLEDNGIDGEDGSLILTRRVTADGKNTCRVNGMPVTVGQLRELGALLIDIHGQNDGRKLLDESAHRAYLDAFGVPREVSQTYADAYRALTDARERLAAVTLDDAERERRVDTLTAQIAELEAARLKIGETDALNARRDIMANASRLQSAFDIAYSALYGGDDEDGAVALAIAAENAVEGLSRYTDKFETLVERLRDLRYNAADIAEEIRDARDELNFSPELLERLDDRLDLLRRMARKFGGDEGAAIEYLDNARAELSELELSDEMRKKLAKVVAECEKNAQKCAESLKKSREIAAERLKIRVTEELSHLSMAGVRFEVEFSPVENELKLSPFGSENARFLMSANAGMAPGRIAKIASGGELSRIMLALKNVLTETDPVDVTVFDEVDAGVSGIAAQRVGEKLATLGRARQVLCVTHLAQIAAMADRHFEISKSVDNNRTFTRVTALDFDGRRAEIARLTGGENVTDAALTAAGEQLSAAEEWKAK